MIQRNHQREGEVAPGALSHPRCPHTCEAAAALTGAAGCRPLFNRPDSGYCSSRPTYSNRAGERPLITAGCQGAQAPSLPPFQRGSETPTCQLCLARTWGRCEKRAEPGHSNLNLKPGWSQTVERRCWKPEGAGLHGGVPDKGAGLYPQTDAWETRERFSVRI